MKIRDCFNRIDNLYFILTLLLLTGCDMIEYHPYDLDVHGDKEINARNSKAIEAKMRHPTMV